MIGILESGSVEYSKEEAAVDIDELIEALQQAQANGVEKVCLASGNYRGAKYQRLTAEIDY